MVTTVIALLAGVALVFVSVSARRFERVLVAATRPQTSPGDDLARRTHSEAVLLRVSRLLTLAVGVICIALGVLDAWSFFR